MAKNKNNEQYVKAAVIHHYGTKPENVIYVSNESIYVFDRFKKGIGGNIVIAKDEAGNEYVTTTKNSDGACLDPYKMYCRDIIKIINKQGDNTNGTTYEIQCDGKTVTLNFPNN